MLPGKTLPLLLLALLVSLPAQSASPPEAAPSQGRGSARITAVTETPPQGNFIELHSCELFAGGCVINSEVDQAGNYVLRVWQFDAGTFHGMPLRGLTVALLEKGEASLAATGHPATAAVVYLPPGLSSTQQSALLAWARRSTEAPLDDAHVRIAPLQAHLTGDQIGFSAGRDIAFTGGTPAECNVGGCGEMLWYQPRHGATSFVVDQLEQSRIVEPLLSLRWTDHGRRTLFVGRFGDPEPTVPAICGAAKTASL